MAKVRQPKHQGGRDDGLTHGLCSRARSHRITLPLVVFFLLIIFIPLRHRHRERPLCYLPSNINRSSYSRTDAIAQVDRLTLTTLAPLVAGDPTSSQSPFHTIHHPVSPLSGLKMKSCLRKQLPWNLHPREPHQPAPFPVLFPIYSMGNGSMEMSSCRLTM